MTERRGIKEYLDSGGFQSFTAPQAMQLLEHLWYSEPPELMALSVNWGRAASRDRLRLPILKDLLREVESGERSPRGSGRGPAADNGDQSPKPGTAEERLRTHIAGLLPARTQLEIAVPLVNLGLDSLGATVLTETLYHEFGLSVEADEFAAGLSFRDLADRVAGTALRGDVNP
jgi:acyl carrier protein